MTLSCDVAITGGGIGGLTVASSLAQRSISAMVFEQDNEVREIGAGAGTACTTPGFCPALQDSYSSRSRAKSMRRRACSLPGGDSVCGVAASTNVRDHWEKAAAEQSDVSAPTISHQERGHGCSRSF
jgi:glycine/D-amino acid oxidase-like deaminating enzyme